MDTFTFDTKSKSIKVLQDIFVNAPTQDLTYTFKYEDVMGDIDSALTFSAVTNMLNEDDKKRIREISIMKLRHNLNTGDIYPYLKKKGYDRKVLLMVVNHSVSSVMYPDSATKCELISGKESIMLEEGTAYWYDAAQPHAMLVAGSMWAFNVYFKRTRTPRKG